MVAALGSIRRALADYSLRKFILFAANPAHWADLLEQRRVAKLQVEEFSRRVSVWLQAVPTPVLSPRLYFRPWLREHLASNLRPGPGAKLPAQSGPRDPEVVLGRDRLGWMLQLALAVDGQPWVEFEHWFEERWQSNLVCCDAYTLSERISNLALMWNLEAPPPAIADKVLDLLASDAKRLLTIIEYHGDSKTNNHVLNNARALIIYGAFAQDANYFHAGCLIFQTESPKHILADGVLREASTHYQLVVTRWVVEIACTFCAVDNPRFQALVPLLEKMLDTCEEMRLGHSGRSYAPLIGDISPDFAPTLYAGLTNFGYALIGTGRELPLAANSHEGFWGHFFVGKVKPDLPDTWLSDEGSWARLTTGQWAILAHIDRQAHDNRPTHGHHDLFSFELAFGGAPLIVDPGRKCYAAPRDSEEAGILEEWHNTIMVNRSRTGFVPRGYMPVTWLANWRSNPEMDVGERSLSIRLNAPREVAGVSRIQRTIQVPADDRVTIVNEVSTIDARGIEVLLVLYILGVVRQEDSRVHVVKDGRSFCLTWAGLGTPTLRPAQRYISYGIAEPCVRLEWIASTKTPNWESVINVELSEECG